MKHTYQGVINKPTLGRLAEARKFVDVDPGTYPVDDDRETEKSVLINHPEHGWVRVTRRAVEETETA